MSILRELAWGLSSIDSILREPTGQVAPTGRSGGSKLIKNHSKWLSKSLKFAKSAYRGAMEGRCEDRSLVFGAYMGMVEQISGSIFNTIVNT